jgi:hypothetical protein
LFQNVKGVEEFIQRKIGTLQESVKQVEAAVKNKSMLSEKVEDALRAKGV